MENIPGKIYHEREYHIFPIDFFLAVIKVKVKQGSSSDRVNASAGFTVHSIHSTPTPYVCIFRKDTDDI